MYKESDYSYRISFSKEDDEFVATVLEFPLLSYLDKTQTGALEGINEVVRKAMEIYAEDGQELPEPLALKKYSGKFALRMTPQQHQRVATEAAEQGVSINQLLVSRI